MLNILPLCYEIWGNIFGCISQPKHNHKDILQKCVETLETKMLQIQHLELNLFISLPVLPVSLLFLKSSPTTKLYITF